LQDHSLVGAVLVRDDEAESLSLLIALGSDEGDLGREYAFDAGQFLVNHVRRAVRDDAHRAAAGRYAVADELLAAKHVEQLETHVVRIVAGLHDPADDHRFGFDERPVVEIEFRPGGRLLQHVFLGNRRKATAALQVRRDHFSDIEGHVGRPALPAERHHCNGRPGHAALGDFDCDVAEGTAREQARRESQNE